MIWFLLACTTSDAELPPPIDPQPVVETHKTSANNEKATTAIKVVPI